MLVCSWKLPFLVRGEGQIHRLTLVQSCGPVSSGSMDCAMKIMAEGRQSEEQDRVSQGENMDVSENGMCL